MKKYKLLKDLPGAKAESIFEESSKGYICRLDGDHWIGFPKFLFNEHPDWFEKVEDSPRRTDMLLGQIIQIEERELVIEEIRWGTPFRVLLKAID